MLLDGIHVPLTAPFYRDGKSYLRKLEHNVRRYSLTPAAGLVALVPGGEGAALCDSEQKESLSAVSETAAKEKLLIAGIAADSVDTALDLGAHAAEAGFDALLVGAPTSWPRLRSQAELLVYFRAIADASEIPVVLWSDASAPSRALAVEEIAELARHANILGLYDADLTADRRAAIAAATEAVKHDAIVTTIFAPVTRRMMAVEATGPAVFVSAESLGGGAAVAVAPPAPALKTRTKTVGFQLMSAGRTTGLLPLLESGVPGAMPQLAACAPQAVHEVYAAFKDGNPKLAAEKASRIAAADDLMADLGIAGIKYACDLNGYYGGYPRLPRLPLDASERERVDQVMAGLRN